MSNVKDINVYIRELEELFQEQGLEVIHVKNWSSSFLFDNDGQKKESNLYKIFITLQYGQALCKVATNYDTHVTSNKQKWSFHRVYNFKADWKYEVLKKHTAKADTAINFQVAHLARIIKECAIVNTSKILIDVNCIQQNLKYIIR